MNEYKEDFTLKDVDLKSKSFFGNLNKKKITIFSIALTAFIVLLILILVIILSSGNKKEEEQLLPTIGELICEYEIKDENHNTVILSYDFIKKTNFDIMINNKIIKFNKEYKFTEKGMNTVIFQIKEDLNMDSMFKDVSSLISINITSTKNVKITSLISAFENCDNLNKFYLEGFDTHDVNSMHKLFYKTHLTKINLTNFNTKNIIDMSYMFTGSPISEIDLTAIDVSSVTNMSHMFDSCSSLKS